MPYRPTKLLLAPAACILINTKSDVASACVPTDNREGNLRESGGKSRRRRMDARDVIAVFKGGTSKKNPNREGLGFFLSSGDTKRNRTRVRYPKQIAMDVVFVLVFGCFSKARINPREAWFGQAAMMSSSFFVVAEVIRKSLAGLSSWPLRATSRPPLRRLFSSPCALSNPRT